MLTETIIQMGRANRGVIDGLLDSLPAGHYQDKAIEHIKENLV